MPGKWIKDLKTPNTKLLIGTFRVDSTPAGLVTAVTVAKADRSTVLAIDAYLEKVQKRKDQLPSDRS